PTWILPIDTCNGLQPIGFVERKRDPQKFVLIVFPLDIPYIATSIRKCTVIIPGDFHGGDPSVGGGKIAVGRRPAPHCNRTVLSRCQLHPTVRRGAVNMLVLGERRDGWHVSPASDLIWCCSSLF